MPVYMDRHDVEGATDEAVLAAHDKDMALQDKYNVRFLTYWYDLKRGHVSCLVDAPDEETLMALHGEAHGLVPNEVIEVDLTDVQTFLGRISDPQPETAPNGTERVPIDSAFRCIVFTDLKDSTSMSRTIGDRAAIDLLESHDEIIRSALTDCRGREIKHTGDGIMASFQDVADSVCFAIDIQRSFLEFNKLGPILPLHVRIGINAGEPVERGQDLFGMAVQIAARTCAHAQPDQILVTGVVYELSKDLSLRGATYRIGDKARFKGFEHAIQLYEVDW